MGRQDFVTGEVTTVTPYFNPQSQIVLEYTDVSEIYDIMVQRILEKIASFNNKCSNWTLRSMIGLEILMDRYRPLGGGSYKTLPSKLAKKNAIVNPNNEDDECFKWAVTIGLDPADVHPERITQRVKDNSRKLCWDGVEFPAKEEDVRAFEKANPDLAINIFGWEKNVSYPIYYSQKNELKRVFAQEKYLKLLREKVKELNEELESLTEKSLYSKVNNLTEELQSLEDRRLYLEKEISDRYDIEYTKKNLQECIQEESEELERLVSHIKEEDDEYDEYDEYDQDHLDSEIWDCELNLERLRALDDLLDEIVKKSAALKKLI